jgi:hypothetical protein
MTKIKLINQLPKEEDLLKRKDFKKVMDGHMSQQSAVKWTERWSIWKSAGLGAAIIGGAFALWSLQKTTPEVARIETESKRIRISATLPDPVLSDETGSENIQPAQIINTAEKTVEQEQPVITEKVVSEKGPLTTKSQSSFNLNYPIEQNMESAKVSINGWQQSTFSTKEVNQIRDVQILDQNGYTSKKVVSFDAEISGKTFHNKGSFFDGSSRRAILQMKSGDKIIISNIKLSDNTTLIKGEEFEIKDKIF